MIDIGTEEVGGSQDLEDMTSAQFGYMGDKEKEVIHEASGCGTPGGGR